MGVLPPKYGTFYFSLNVLCLLLVPLDQSHQKTAEKTQTLVKQSSNTGQKRNCLFFSVSFY